MRRSRLRMWLGTGVASSLLAFGCGYSQKNCNCGRASSGHISPVAVSQVPGRTVPQRSPYNMTPMGMPGEVVSAPAVAPATEPPPLPVVTSVAKPTSREGADAPAAPAKAADDPSDPSELQTIAGRAVREGAASRRSYPDITANPAFAHAPDYSSVVGELGCVLVGGVEKVWVVRYASVDEEDRYGGGFTLVDLGDMKDFRDGQMVRVQGQLVDPDSRDLRPHYRVRSLQAMDR